MFKLSNQCFVPKLFIAFFSFVVISLFSNQATAQFGPTPTFAPAVSYPHVNRFIDNQLVVGDFNNDGKPDLAAVCGEYGSGPGCPVTVFLNDGSGGFGAPIVTSDFIMAPPPRQLLLRILIMMVT
jgi:hypothetical protein